ncbi:DUF58 domain-containing protein [Dokdonella sp.]|uniref:DUF58 domain-containing protein n=1 Tax=Dokdonella sp. TaxID=2291710 RepID=UPI0037835D8B
MRPTSFLVALLLLLAGAGLLVAFDWLPVSVLGVLCLALAALGLLDARRVRALPSPEVARELPAVVPVGVERRVELRLHNVARRSLRLDVHDLHPGDWPVFGLQRHVVLPPGRTLDVAYRVTPAARGAFAFDGCAVRIVSPLRLWRQQRVLPPRQQVRVYPNFAPLAKLALVGAEQASRTVGAHVRRRRGEGTEFQQLRDYRLGDSMRQIDWKASQRTRRLISREYQDERNQRVMLLLDTGRRMLARDGALSHFDHVLNAALMVAYIALRQGDAVGLLASGGDSRYVAPHRGLATIDTLLNTLFDLDARAVATDYLAAATLLGARQPRRSLVLLVTNARDEDIEDLLAAVQLLQKRHLVCVASLREDVLDRLRERAVRTLDDALETAAMAQYLEQRARAHRMLRAQGADVLDVTCAELPAALVEHYLAMKRAARL